MGRSAKKKLGSSIFIASLVFYFLMELPFALSVKCGNVNEGFYFGYGQSFLKGAHLYSDIYAARGPLFILLYALVVKIFSFNAASIIAIHFLHSITIALIGLAIYLTAEKLFHSSFYAGITVLFWVLIQLSPIGLWGGELEYESAFSFEAEYLCVLVSIFSIYFLILSFEKNQIIYSLLGGFLASCSPMFKGSGVTISVATFCWAIYLFLFQNMKFRELKQNLVTFFAAMVISLFLFLTALYIHNGELNTFFDKFYALGYYSNSTSWPIRKIFTRLIGFMFKYTLSWSNFFLFFFAFLGFVLELVKIFFVKKSNLPFQPFFLLIYIWGIGNLFAAILPGIYSSYYYLLLYPSCAISLVQILQNIFNWTKASNFKVIVVFIVLLFFIQRFYTTLPTYFYIVKKIIPLNCFYQPESFQDPVKHPYGECLNSRRPLFLRVADKINSYLPNKEDRFFIFNFARGHLDFSPYIYIYAKRTPSTTVYSDWLHMEKLADRSAAVLLKDLLQSPPKILIFPANGYIKKGLAKHLLPLFNGVDSLLSQKYHLKDTLYYKYSPLEESEIDLIYERNN